MVLATKYHSINITCIRIIIITVNNNVCIIINEYTTNLQTYKFSSQKTVCKRWDYNTYLVHINIMNSKGHMHVWRHCYCGRPHVS